MLSTYKFIPERFHEDSIGGVVRLFIFADGW